VRTQIRGILLTIDALVNLLLGGILLLLPTGVFGFLGLPPSDTFFYTSVLGGVLFGIGVALLIERSPRLGRGFGLGLGGAIAINTCGAATLVGWLVLGSNDLPGHGRAVLWSVAAIVLAICAAEVVAMLRKRDA